jgi:cytosine/uracil/thiamine/allantoin permease
VVVRAGMISTVLAVVFVPWLWFDQAARVYDVLNVIGGALGPVAGIMLADLFLVRGRRCGLAHAALMRPVTAKQPAMELA